MTHPLITKTLVLIFVLGLMASSAVQATDTAGSSVSNPNTVADPTVPTSATPASAPTVVNPTLHKHHYLPRKKSNNTANDGAAVPNGMADSIGTNNAGSPNMGSGDHTPGSTGTSGQ